MTEKKTEKKEKLVKCVVADPRFYAKGSETPYEVGTEIEMPQDKFEKLLGFGVVNHHPSVNAPAVKNADKKPAENMVTNPKK